MAPVTLSILSVLAHLVVLHSAEYSAEEPAKHCPGHFCNDIVGDISFPFRSLGDRPDCGLFTVDCSEPDGPKIQLKEVPRPFIKDRDLADRLEKDHCDGRAFDDLSLPSAFPIPEVALFTHNLTLFICDTTLDKNSYPQLNVSCRTGPNDTRGYNPFTYYMAPSNGNLPSPPPPECDTIQVPVLPAQPITFSSLTAEFSLEVLALQCNVCHVREGECLVEEGKFKCTTREIVHVAGDKKLKLMLGLVGAASVVVVLVVVCCFFWKKCIQKHQIVEAFLRSYGPLQVQRHSYLEVKKMTNFFYYIDINTVETL